MPGLLFSIVRNVIIFTGVIFAFPFKVLLESNLWDSELVVPSGSRNALGLNITLKLGNNFFSICVLQLLAICVLQLGQYVLSNRCFAAKAICVLQYVFSNMRFAAKGNMCLASQENVPLLASPLHPSDAL